MIESRRESAHGRTPPKRGLRRSPVCDARAASAGSARPERDRGNESTASRIRGGARMATGRCEIEAARPGAVERECPRRQASTQVGFFAIGYGDGGSLLRSARFAIAMRAVRLRRRAFRHGRPSAAGDGMASAR